MPHYMTKTVSVEARQVDAKDADGVREIIQWIRDGGRVVTTPEKPGPERMFLIHPQQGTPFIHLAAVRDGDYVVRNGEAFFGLAPDSFAARYVLDPLEADLLRESRAFLQLLLWQSFAGYCRACASSYKHDPMTFEQFALMPTNRARAEGAYPLGSNNHLDAARAAAAQEQPS